MENFLIRAAQLILCLSILVVLHEGGHFFFAKIFGIRVEKFYMFFDYKFHLFSTYSNWWRKLIGKKPVTKGPDGNYPYVGTEYGIGWIPLGGYVKIAGMIDESMDTDQMKQPAQPWEFRTKPAWQRLLVMLGGVMVNFFLALFIYSMILFAWGEQYIPIRNMTMGFTFNQQAKEIGFKDGDIIIGTETNTFRDFNTDVVRSISTAKTVTVMRNGKSETITMPDGGLNLLDMFQSEKPFLSTYIPTIIDSVITGSAAHKALLQKGDKITSFNNCPTQTWSDYNAAVRHLAKQLEGATTNDSLRKRNVQIAVMHTSGQTDTMHIMLDTELRMGVIQASALNYYKPTTVHYSFFESFPAGCQHGINVFKGYVSDLKYLFTKEGAKSVGSFGAIGSMFPTAWDWQRFWELTAFISIILAFMNILPIPALDGGHAMFLLIEMIFRRKFSLRFQERAQMIGMFILLLLMVYAIGNDIFRFLL